MAASIPNFSNPLNPTAGPTGVNLGRIAVPRVGGGDVVSALEQAIPALTAATRKVVQEHRQERVRTIETFLNSETGVQFTQGLRNAKDDAAREAMFQGAVEDGLLPASDSPYFRHVWNKREALRAGQVLQGRLEDAIVRQRRTAPTINEESQEIIPGEDFETVFQDIVSKFSGNSALGTEVGSEVWLTEAARWKQAYATQSNRQVTAVLESRQTQLITSGFSASLAELSVDGELGGDTTRSWVADFSSLSDEAQEQTIRMMARELADYEKANPGKGRDAFARLLEVEGVNGIPLGDPRNAGLIDMMNRLDTSLEAAENSSTAGALRKQGGREQDGQEFGSAVAAGTMTMEEAKQELLQRRKEQGDTILPDYAETLINRGVIAAQNSAILGESESAAKLENLIDQMKQASGAGELSRITASGRDLTASDKNILAGYAEERGGYIDRGVHLKISKYEREAIPQAESIGFELPDYEKFTEMKPQEMQRILDRVKKQFQETRITLLNVGQASGYSGLPAIDSARVPKGVPQHSPLYEEAVEARNTAIKEREDYVSSILRDINVRYDPLEVKEKAAAFQTLLNDRSSGFARREDIYNRFNREVQEVIFGDALATVARDEDLAVSVTAARDRLKGTAKDALPVNLSELGSLQQSNTLSKSPTQAIDNSGTSARQIEDINSEGDILRASLLGKYTGQMRPVTPAFEQAMTPDSYSGFWLGGGFAGLFWDFEAGGVAERRQLLASPEDAPVGSQFLSEEQGDPELLKGLMIQGAVNWKEFKSRTISQRATGVHRDQTSSFATPVRSSFAVPAMKVGIPDEVLYSLQLDAVPMYRNVKDVEKAFDDPEFTDLLVEIYKANGAEKPDNLVDKLKAKMIQAYAE